MSVAGAVVVACVQLSPGADRAANLTEAINGTREAAARGAWFVFFPEYATLLNASGRVMREAAMVEHFDLRRSFRRAPHVWSFADRRSSWCDCRERGDEPAVVVVAEINLSEVVKARSRIPSLTHDRPFEVEIVDARSNVAADGHPLL
jgi:predicted amidohydrolase